LYFAGENVFLKVQNLVGVIMGWENKRDEREQKNKNNNNNKSDKGEE
jgi:hypothetical protein